MYDLYVAYFVQLWRPTISMSKELLKENVYIQYDGTYMIHIDNQVRCDAKRSLMWM